MIWLMYPDSAAERITLPDLSWSSLLVILQKNLIMESLYKLKHAAQKFKNVIVAHDD